MPALSGASLVVLLIRLIGLYPVQCPHSNAARHWEKPSICAQERSVAEMGWAFSGCARAGGAGRLKATATD